LSTAAIAGPESGFLVSAAADRAERTYGERIDWTEPEHHVRYGGHAIPRDIEENGA
jgi:hypothetical protein